MGGDLETMKSPEAGTILLVHGAGSGPRIFDDWKKSLPGFAVLVVDLQEGLDVATSSMNDYRQRVVSAIASMKGPVALCGWSMGGLVALMAAEKVKPAALILLEPSPPGEVQGFDAGARVEPGTFDPEEVYGPFPGGIPARPESSLARGERKRGISVPAVACPMLVISGDDFPEERGSHVADLYDAEHRHFPGLNHWDLVLRPEVREAISSFLRVRTEA